VLLRARSCLARFSAKQSLRSRQLLCVQQPCLKWWHLSVVCAKSARNHLAAAVVRTRVANFAVLVLKLCCRC
jgi:hypothetical protein